MADRPGQDLGDRISRLVEGAPLLSADDFAKEALPLLMEADNRLSEYEQAMRPFLAHPRWLSIGSSDNTVEIRVSAEAFERARAALSGSAGSGP